MRIRRVVTGTDGTTDCEAALMWAADEADRHAGHLVVVHAWEVTAEHRAPYARMPSYRPACERACAAAVLDHAVALVKGRYPRVTVEERLVRGRPESVLAEQARGADLLVLGSAAQLAGDGRLGAVLLSCLRRPPCPVVVVPPAGLGAAQPVDAGLAVAR